MSKRKGAKVERLEDLICRLIPYMEGLLTDDAYKPGAIRNLLREMNQVLAESLCCEICGEPAGEGGALCPVHLDEANSK